MLVAPIQNVGDTLLQLLNEVLLYLPRIITAAIILLVGYVVARVVRTLLTKGLRLVHFDNVADRAGVTRALQLADIKLDAAGVLGAVAFWWIFLAFIEMALDSLQLTAITGFIHNLLDYIPNVFVAILILIVGSLVAHVVADIIKGAGGEAGISTTPMLATIARSAILLFAVLAALTQLNIAQNMIFILFAAIVGMAALAGGLAFGLGGADSARSLLAGWTTGRMLQNGQRVQIGQQSGTVLRHDLNATILDTKEGQVSIPNANLVKEEFMVLNNK